MKVDIEVVCRNGCGLNLRVPLDVGFAYPMLPAVCPKCNESATIIGSINVEGKNVPKTSPLISEPLPTYPTLPIGQLNNRILADEHPSKPDGHNRSGSYGIGGSLSWTAFHGRISQVFVIMQTLAKMSEGRTKGETKLTIEDVTQQITAVFQELNWALSLIEREHNIGRGECLSVAFPIKERQLSIMFRVWLGIDMKRGLKTTPGELEKRGLIEHVSKNEIMLTEYERALSDLEVDLGKYILELRDPIEILGDRRPFLPVLYSKKIVLEMTRKLATIWPNDAQFLTELLQLIDKASTNESKDGWDSNDYASQQVSIFLEPLDENSQLDTQRVFWLHKYESYYRSAQRRKKRHPHQIAREKTITNINSTLGGCNW